MNRSFLARSLYFLGKKKQAKERKLRRKKREENLRSKADTENKQLELPLDEGRR